MKNLKILLVLIITMFLSCTHKQECTHTFQESNTDTIYTIVRSHHISNDAWSNLRPIDRKIYVKEFVYKYDHLFEKYSKIWNIPKEILAWRAAVESTWGTNILMKSNNLYGIHYVSYMSYLYDYYLDEDRQGFSKAYPFCKYEDVEQSINHFCEFVCSQKYNKHITNNTPKEWVESLCIEGYSINCVKFEMIWNIYQNAQL